MEGGNELYDLLIKDGEVIDPIQGIHDKRDVGIKDGKIVAVEKSIVDSRAREVLPVNGKMLIPGLIDSHCHPAGELAERIGLPPDKIGLDSGVTLVCDCGSIGSANFHAMRRFIIEPARTDVFCFLNLATTGAIKAPEIWDEHDISPELTKQVVEENRDLIKGIKIRVIQSLTEGIGIKAVEIAKKLATDLKLPLMMHIGEGSRERVAHDIMDDFTRAAVKLMEKGDILSHYMTPFPGGLILPDGTVYPELWEAQKNGVILDPCPGINNCSFTIAKQALRQGLLPNVISSDLAMPPGQSLLVIMSEFLQLGLTIEQVVEMTTINAAKVLGEEAQRGSLKPGVPANISILEIVKGDYLFSDGNGQTIRGDLLLEPRLVLKAGVEMPCHSCYHLPSAYASVVEPTSSKS